MTLTQTSPPAPAAPTYSAPAGPAATLAALELLTDLGGAAYVGVDTDRNARTIAMHHASELEAEGRVEFIGRRNARLAVILRGARP